MWRSLRKTSDFPTIEERREGHQKNIAELIPPFLRFQRGGPYYFGNKHHHCQLTIADLELYIVSLELAAMYGSKDPFKSGQYPKLAKLIETLDGGRAGEYARTRRLGANLRWHEDQQKWGPHVKKA